MTTVTAQQTAADLLSAANHLETFGWVRGAFGSIGQPCCTDGAIIAAVGIDVNDPLTGTTEQAERAEAAERAFAEFIGEYSAFPARVVWLWNDGSPSREVVCAKLRAAAEAVFPNG